MRPEKDTQACQSSGSWLICQCDNYENIVKSRKFEFLGTRGFLGHIALDLSLHPSSVHLCVCYKN